MKPYTLSFPFPNTSIRTYPIVDYSNGELIVIDNVTTVTDSIDNDVIYFSVTGGESSGNKVDPTFISLSKFIDLGPKGIEVRREVFSYGVDQTVTTGRISAFSPDWPSEDSQLENDAIAGLYDQIRGSLDLSISLFQSKQLAAQLRTLKPFLSFVSAFNNPRNWSTLGRRFKGVMPKKGDPDRAKWIGSKWLEYQYGWKPLVSDIYDTTKLLLEGQVSKPMRLKSRRRYHDQNVNKLSFSYPETGQSVIISDLEQRVEYSVDLVPKPSLLTEVSAFSSLNPLSIAWETLPYSFVVDWFLNVGGYVRSLESSIIFRDHFVRGYRTLSTRKRCDFKLQYYYELGNLSILRQAEGVQEIRSKMRSPLTGLPTPAFPGFRPKLGSGRLLNAAALLSQFLR